MSAWKGASVTVVVGRQRREFDTLACALGFLEWRLLAWLIVNQWLAWVELAFADVESF